MSSNDVSPSGPIVALAADMIFGAKIRGTGQAVGADIVLARNAKQLLEVATAGQSAPKLIIIDLDTRGLDIAATITTIKQQSPQTPILAYVSHVNADAIRAAREAGADKVLARSAFTAGLADILKNS